MSKEFVSDENSVEKSSVQIQNEKQEGEIIYQEEIVDVWEARTSEEKMGTEIVSSLQKKGKAYFCGGYVRDFLINQKFQEHFEPKDIDIATELGPEEITDILQQEGFRIKQVGEKFGVLLAYRNEDQSDAIQIATFRKEEEYLDGRHPDKVILIRDPQKDAQRRDFTINALFFDPLSKKVIDYVGGIKDLEGKILRPVGDPKERFSEDYLRMLRYVRFRAKYGFNFSQEVKQAIKGNKEKIAEISHERIRDELDFMLELPKRHIAFADLARLGLLEYILPEMYLLKNVEHPRGAPYHKEGDALRHTLEALRVMSQDDYIQRVAEVLQTPGENKEKVMQQFFEKYGTDVAWAVVFHDLGKRTHRRKEAHAEGGEKTTFKKHEIGSADMTSIIANRLHFSNEQKQKIVWLVENHMRTRDIPSMRQSRKRPFLQHPWIEELLFLMLADQMGNMPKSTKDFDEVLFALKEERARPSEPKHLVGGDVLMKMFSITPGPLIGELKDIIREAQLEEKIHTEEEAIEYAREYLRRRSQ